MSSLLDNLPHKCTISRRVRVRDGTGSGRKDSYTVVSSGVACWEQQASTTEVVEYQKRGMSVNRKVYFTSDPGVGENHVVIITERNGVAIAAASQEELDVVSEPQPDASAGLGIVYRVMVNSSTGD